jgi:hypothetical protein
MLQREYVLGDLRAPIYDLAVASDGSWAAVLGTQERTEVTGPALVYEKWRLIDQALVVNGTSLSMPAECRFPIVAMFDDHAVAVMDSRAEPEIANAWIVRPDGSVESEFRVGDGVNNAITVGDHLVVGYFDEGVFGSPGPNNDGIAVFNRDGSFKFGYTTEFGDNAVSIADAYAICRGEGQNDFYFDAYDSFAVVRLELDPLRQTVWPTPDRVHGANPISVRGRVAYLHGSYWQRGMLFRFDLDTSELSELGPLSKGSKGLPGGRFLAVGDAGYTVITVDE